MKVSSPIVDINCLLEKQEAPLFRIVSAFIELVKPFFDAPEDQIRSVTSLNHDALETFDPCLAEIPLNVQIMSRILEDQQVLRFNCLGDLFHEITISGPSVPVATLLRREF
jgi:hypothetical protein